MWENLIARNHSYKNQPIAKIKNKTRLIDLDDVKTIAQYY